MLNDSARVVANVTVAERQDVTSLRVSDQVELAGLCCVLTVRLTLNRGLSCM